jgi:hypothetical protein
LVLWVRAKKIREYLEVWRVYPLPLTTV